MKNLCVVLMTILTMGAIFFSCCDCVNDGLFVWSKVMGGFCWLGVYITYSIYKNLNTPADRVYLNTNVIRYK